MICQTSWRNSINVEWVYRLDCSACDEWVIAALHAKLKCVRFFYTPSALTRPANHKIRERFNTFLFSITIRASKSNRFVYVWFSVTITNLTVWTNHLSAHIGTTHKCTLSVGISKTHNLNHCTYVYTKIVLTKLFSALLHVSLYADSIQIWLVRWGVNLYRVPSSSLQLDSVLAGFRYIWTTGM